MKLTIALFAAAFMLAPGSGFAMDQSAEASHYPYPDWPAIAKTAPSPATAKPSPEEAEKQKAWRASMSRHP
jgi:hypothetical protein